MTGAKVSAHGTVVADAKDPSGIAVPVAPGGTIGILGSGQLGRMLALAAARLGLQVRCYADTSGPAFDICGHSTIGSYEDAEAVTAFARSVDVVTYEFENVPATAAAAAAAVCPLRPGPRALEVAQDRVTEKRFVASLGLPVAPFRPIEGVGDLAPALAALGTPAILKTRRFGYDGKGQVRVEADTDPAAAFAAIGEAPAILEGLVAFAAEVSVVLVRGIDGATAFYDVPGNEHRGGILRRSTVPGPLAPDEVARARAIAARIADALDYVGVLAVEMFHVPGAREPLIVNEIAPRVHNSGHWTLDACLVSQFENHIRAVAGWPLGDTARHSDAVMDNLIGEDVAAWDRLAAEPATAVHLYGKREARRGRKMGHVTRLSPRS